MSKQPLISEKAHERQHTIRGMCKRKAVTAKDYAEYQQDKKLIKIAPNFKKLMDLYTISIRYNTHEHCIKHVIKPFVKETLCPDDVPENRKIITHHIGRLIEGLENADKKGEEKIALRLESYLTRLVSTKYGTFTGGKRRRRTRKRKRRGGVVTREVFNLHELERSTIYLVMMTIINRDGSKDTNIVKVKYRSSTENTPYPLEYIFHLTEIRRGGRPMTLKLKGENHEMMNDHLGWKIFKYVRSGGRKKSKKRRKRNSKKRTRRRRRKRRR